ncbi:MAG: SH3 domain-containing protein [Gemmatales bacterium]|nr:SH3 domain-containing protein [Gemmatales bacterium]MDW8386450.1 SH3 domain-containing protein [Gemmatales bacterium]
MKRFAVAIIALSFAVLLPTAWSAEETIVVPEVEVRSGPSASALFYPTGKLRAGDRVQVVGEPENGYLKIVPPPGSFSLVLKKDVHLLNANSGQIVAEQAMTVMGGLTPTYNVRGTYLPRGTVVTVLGSETIHTAQGPVEYYKIVPINEYRYIPASAVRRTSDGGSASQPGAERISPDIAAKLQAAEEAYRRGEATGDYSEALRLYQELQQSPSHEVRLAAWNRIEFIKQKIAGTASGPVIPAGFRDNIGPGGSSRSGGSGPMQPRSSYTYAPDDGRSFRTPPNAPGSWQSAPSASQMPRTPAPTTPNQSQYAPTNPKPAPSTPTVLVGRLVRSSKTDINGKPLYALVDSQNQIKCYVSGTNLERFLEQNVVVEGDGLIYHAYLRNNVLRATEVKLLN